jgi:hypothetical protein
VTVNWPPTSAGFVESVVQIMGAERLGVSWSVKPLAVLVQENKMFEPECVAFKTGGALVEAALVGAEPMRRNAANSGLVGDALLSPQLVP